MGRKGTSSRGFETNFKNRVGKSRGSDDTSTNETSSNNGNNDKASLSDDSSPLKSSLKGSAGGYDDGSTASSVSGGGQGQEQDTGGRKLSLNGNQGPFDILACNGNRTRGRFQQQDELWQQGCLGNPMALRNRLEAYSAQKQFCQQPNGSQSNCCPPPIPLMCHVRCVARGQDGCCISCCYNPCCCQPCGCCPNPCSIPCQNPGQNQNACLIQNPCQNSSKNACQHQNACQKQDIAPPTLIQGPSQILENLILVYNDRDAKEEENDEKDDENGDDDNSDDNDDENENDSTIFLDEKKKKGKTKKRQKKKKAGSQSSRSSTKSSGSSGRSKIGSRTSSSSNVSSRRGKKKKKEGLLKSDSTISLSSRVDSITSIEKEIKKPKKKKRDGDAIRSKSFANDLMKLFMSAQQQQKQPQSQNLSMRFITQEPPSPCRHQNQQQPLSGYSQNPCPNQILSSCQDPCRNEVTNCVPDQCQQKQQNPCNSNNNNQNTCQNTNKCSQPPPPPVNWNLCSDWKTRWKEGQDVGTHNDYGNRDNFLSVLVMEKSKALDGDTWGAWKDEWLKDQILNTKHKNKDEKTAKKMEKEDRQQEDDPEVESRNKRKMGKAKDKEANNKTKKSAIMSNNKAEAKKKLSKK